MRNYMDMKKHRLSSISCKISALVLSDYPASQQIILPVQVIDSLKKIERMETLLQMLSLQTVSVLKKENWCIENA